MFRDFKRVEIELHSYCNRKCTWCPNHYVDRPYTILNEEIFLSILNSLKNNNFQDKILIRDYKYISLNGYSEPFSKPDLLVKRINQIREILPSIDVVINTNGDFLTKEVLREVAIQQISIMDYDSKGQDYWVKKFKELGILIVSKKVDRVIGTHRNITKIICKLNWTSNFEIENRGGFLPRKLEGEAPKWRNDRIKRTVTCYEPVMFPVINSDGNVMPCCHMRADIHKEFILGNVYDMPLHEIFKKDKYLKFKDIILSGEIDKYPKECQHCHKYRDNPYSCSKRYELREKYKGIGLNKNKLSTMAIRRDSGDI